MISKLYPDAYAAINKCIKAEGACKPSVVLLHANPQPVPGPMSWGGCRGIPHELGAERCSSWGCALRSIPPQAGSSHLGEMQAPQNTDFFKLWCHGLVAETEISLSLPHQAGASTAALSSSSYPAPRLLATSYKLI